MISSAGRAPPLQGGGRRFDPVITHHFGSLAQLVEQLTFNQLVAGSNPARPTNVKKRPKGAFLLSAIYKIRTCRRFGSCLMRCAYQAYRRHRTRRPDKTLIAIRHRRHRTRRPDKTLIAIRHRRHRTRRPDKTLIAIRHRRHRTRRPDKTLVAIRHRHHTVNAATSFSSAGVACCWSYTIYKSAGIRSSNGRNTTPGQLICA